MPDPGPRDGLHQIAPAALPADATRPAPLLFDAEHRPIATPAAWAARRAELRDAWTRFLGTIRVPRVAPVLTVIEEDRPDGAVRQLVRYEAEPGLPVEGYLLRPEGAAPAGKRRPGVVVLHPTTEDTIRQPAGLAGPAEKHIGLHLARRGYVAFCPCNYLWQYGSSKNLNAAVAWLAGRHPGVTGMAKMLLDAVRAVDALAALPDVDPGRLGAIGHSLGAKEALYLAAFDDRVRAAVSSEGGIGLSYSNWEAPWYLGEAIRRPGFALDHGQVLGLVAPRAFLLIGGDSADGDRSWPYVEAALPLWRLLGAPDAVGLFNHRQGHAYPPEAVRVADAWLDRYLRDA
jgi:dienelactone hydrolase